jgi:hypothetical protein
MYQETTSFPIAKFLCTKVEQNAFFSFGKQLIMYYKVQYLNI